jgi:hypothetical protein
LDFPGHDGLAGGLLVARCLEDSRKLGKIDLVEAEGQVAVVAQEFDVRHVDKVAAEAAAIPEPRGRGGQIADRQRTHGNARPRDVDFGDIGSGRNDGLEGGLPTRQRSMRAPPASARA